MKRLLTISILALLSACGEKPISEEVSVVEEPKNILENLAYSVDTLVVDSGEEIFDLRNFGGPYYTTVSHNRNEFYYFDSRRYILHEIDLNSLQLVNNYPFEKEGPNGIGRFSYTINSLPNGNLFVLDLLGKLSGIFSKTGRKLNKIELNEKELLQGTNLEHLNNIATELTVDLKWNKLYSVPRSHVSKEIFFAVMDSLGNPEEILELSEFQKIYNFQVELNTGGGGGFLGERLFLQQLNELVLISSTVGNAIYIYDPQQDSLFYKEFSHTIAPLEKDVEVNDKVFSEKEFQAEKDKLHTQINYWDFYWDEHKQRYYRFASKGLPPSNIDSPQKFEHFLFVYDKELTLKGETKLEGFEKIPAAGFFKDGKLWSYVNIEDELGFAVFTFDF
ncbi:DUF4221 family protein [Algoriphagus aquimarinus]|uniref:DUF4221 family protein n=1 Tax=Algoriphagus aquimarinus TaxID=237018 RepID=UPI0030D9C7E8|tara:strand:+ start:6291 stop:7460 length:1170 start_codon:yes stop_codon:yes gene_type:complete